MENPGGANLPLDQIDMILDRGLVYHQLPFAQIQPER